MPDPLRLTLLGAARAHAGDAPVRCASRKAFALFAYLAITRRPHPRRALAALLWGGRDIEAARGSLRASLVRLPSALAAYVAVERESLALADAPGLECDVTRFEALAASADPVRLQAAVALYNGHLMQDFEAEATAEFDDWLLRERDRLKQLAYQVFDRLIAQQCERPAQGGADGACDAAVGLARRWLALDPAAERAHRWLMRVALDSGRPEAAQAQYDSCQRALAISEGRAPMAETRALLAPTAHAATHARGHLPDAPVDAVTTPPVASTSFVGRLEEVAALARLVADPACRLVTLHGLGGVGKTRLAHAVAGHVAARFTQGVAWVSLDGVGRPEAVADTLARALCVQLGARVATRDLLLQHLRSQQRLLVLDNMEHLLGAAVGDPASDPVELMLAILREAPGVRFLVTSRQTLDVQEEWVYGVEGLPHRGAERAGPDASPPGVELFAQRARQAYLGFSLAAEMPHVLRICAQVDGLPLGIELAAAWVRTIPCAEIAEELARGIDLPAASQRNRPERQQSLRSVIDFSWRLLASDHQDVLAALSAFRGGFTRDAAGHVAQASLRVLSSLVDKALVRRSADSRFSLHPLVRAFAAEKLDATRSRRAATRARHAEHYLRLLGAQRGALNGTGHAAARRLLESDLDNIRAAWEWAVEAGDPAAVRDAARPLCLILDRVGLYDEWTRTFERALESFVPTSSEESRAAHHQLLVAAGNGHWRRGDVARAGTYHARLAEAIGGARRPVELAELYLLSGLIARDAGRFDGALDDFHAAAEAAMEAGDLLLQAQVANEVGVLHFRRGEFDRAGDAFRASLAQSEAGGNVYQAPMAVHNIAYCDLEAGRFDAADEGLGRAWRLFSERADARGEAMALSSLGILARRRGDFPRARDLARQSLSLAERTANAGAIADATDDLAQAVEKLGDLAAAQRLYAQALVMARELGQVHLQCFVLLHLARAQAAAENRAGSARSLDEALRLADDHDFQSGRLMALLGAARLRAANADAPARSIAKQWCRAVLAHAGANVDVRDAVPTWPDDSVEPDASAAVTPALATALADALRFLATLAAGVTAGDDAGDDAAARSR